MNIVADPGLYILEPIGSRATPRLFVVYNDEAVLVPIPVQRAVEEPCAALYDGRFWAPQPCRKTDGHDGFHADQYGRTWRDKYPQEVTA